MQTSQTRSTQRGTVKWWIVLLFAVLWPATASPQTYTLAPFPPTVFDNSGNIISSGCIWTFLTGTTTAATTYSTQSGTANANPIIADSAGRFVAYLTPGVIYRFRYENTPCSAASPGTVLRTVDGIAAVGTAGTNMDVASQTAGEALSLGDLVYLSDGSGGQTAGRWYQADADNTYSSTTAVTVGFVTAAIASGSEGTIRTAGRMTGLSLSAGETYYASATAAALTATPPTNARCVGKADSTTTLIIPCELGDVRMADSDGTHSLSIRTSSDLTADRLVTLVPGDAARTVTISGNATISQDYSTTGAPSFNAFRPPQGRCSLTTALPVTVADVTAATTLYYALLDGNQITLYDGSTRWVQTTFTELSLAVPATTSTMYDVFVDYTAGVPALEVVAWSSDSARATSLALLNGVYVQTSDTDSLYVCSFRTTGVSGQTEDSFAKRYIYNHFNQVWRCGRVIEATDSWTFTSTTPQQANNSAANQLDFVTGIAGQAIWAKVAATGSADSAGDVIGVEIGLNGLTAATASLMTVPRVGTDGNERFTTVAEHVMYPAAGRNYLTWLEIGSTTTTYYGDNGNAFTQSGIIGCTFM